MSFERSLVLALVMTTIFCTTAARADVFPFRMPSGNIDCTVGQGDGPSDISCTIHDRGGQAARLKPAGCSGAWGHHFAMKDRGAVEMRCGPPGARATAPGVNVANYGQRGDFGGIVCQSSRQGLECRNLDGHGFFLSRARQTVF